MSAIERMSSVRMAELQRLAERAAEGARDPEAMKTAYGRMDRVADQATEVPHPLHADERIVAEPRRMLVSRPDPEVCATRRVLERGRPGGEALDLRRARQGRTATLPIDREARRPARQSRPRTSRTR